MQEKIDARVDIKDSFARAAILFEISRLCRKCRMLDAAHFWAWAATRVTAQQRFEPSMKNG
jgi:hypothetical protein